jgi:hypothetical protein
MDLAVRTTASPAAIWVIVIVAVVLLAFWLFMVMVFATRPDPRLRPAAGMPGSGAAMLDHGAFANLGMAPPQPGTRVPEQRGPAAPAEPAPAVGAVEPPAEPIPGQRTPASGSAPAETANRPGAGNQT